MFFEGLYVCILKKFRDCQNAFKTESNVKVFIP